MFVLQNQEATALYDEAQRAMSEDKFDLARRKLHQAHQMAPQVAVYRAKTEMST